MATFIIETYLSRARPGDLAAATTRLRTAIGRAPSSDGKVRHIRSFYVPEDEMAIHLVEAAALEDAIGISAAAGLAADRIVEAEPASD